MMVADGAIAKSGILLIGPGLGGCQTASLGRTGGTAMEDQHINEGSRMSLFPTTLVSCISEARIPNATETAEIAEHIWNDAFQKEAEENWRALKEYQPDGYYRMMRVARAALCGDHQ